MIRKPSYVPWIARLSLNARSELNDWLSVSGCTWRAEKPSGVRFGLYVNVPTPSGSGSAAAVVVSASCSFPRPTKEHSISSPAGRPVQLISEVIVAAAAAAALAHG